MNRYLIAVFAALLAPLFGLITFVPALFLALPVAHYAGQGGYNMAVLVLALGSGAALSWWHCHGESV